MENEADILLVDGKHALWRSADAFRDLSIELSDGVMLPTGAIYGFLTIITRARRTFGGTVVVAWDSASGPAERRKLYIEYKRRRQLDELDEDRLESLRTMLFQQKRLRKLLSILGIRQAWSRGWEADDVIARICTYLTGSSSTIVILSGDRDLLQLVKPGITQARPGKKGEFKLSTPETVREEFGVEPHQILDLKALAGDPSDNIPGAPGIGPKTATALLQEHGSWEDVLCWAHKNAASGKRIPRLLSDHAKQVSLSADLARLNPNIKLTWGRLQPDKKRAVKMMMALKFKTLLMAKNLDQLVSMGELGNDTTV